MDVNSDGWDGVGVERGERGLAGLGLAAGYFF